MKGPPTTSKPRYHAAIAPRLLPAVRQDFGDDGLGTLDHFLSGAAAWKVQHEDGARRIHTPFQHQMSGCGAASVLGLARAPAPANISRGPALTPLGPPTGVPEGGRTGAWNGLKRIECSCPWAFHHRRDAGTVRISISLCNTLETHRSGSRIAGCRARRETDHMRPAFPSGVGPPGVLHR